MQGKVMGQAMMRNDGPISYRKVREMAKRVTCSSFPTGTRLVWRFGADAWRYWCQAKQYNTSMMNGELFNITLGARKADSPQYVEIWAHSEETPAYVALRRRFTEPEPEDRAGNTPSGGFKHGEYDLSNMIPSEGVGTSVVPDSRTAELVAHASLSLRTLYVIEGANDEDVAKLRRVEQSLRFILEELST